MPIALSALLAAKARHIVKVVNILPTIKPPAIHKAVIFLSPLRRTISGQITLTAVFLLQSAGHIRMHPRQVTLKMCLLFQ